MINHINIKNFAIIENLDIEFSDGLNILTGETGAGKSIIIEAISLALGARADSSYIRTGKDKALVQLSGELDGNEIIISREISSNGKNLCKLNGEMITLANLNSVCRKLADIHGQYDNQQLLDPDNHIIFLDSFAKDSLQKYKEEVSIAYESFTEKYQQLKQLLSNEQQDKEKLEFYKYQLAEIEKLNLKIGEDENLEEEIELLQNSEKIYRNIENIYEKIYGNNTTTLSNLYDALKSLELISDYSKDIAAIKTRFADAYYSLEDLNAEIRTLRDSITFSQATLDASIARLEVINSAKSKYGNSISEILDYKEKINNALGNNIDIAHEKNTLMKEVDELKADLLKKSVALSKERIINAKNLQKQLEDELSQLNFSDCTVDINFSRLDVPSSDGIDKVEFLISTNQGEPVKPLSKVASGGEISRIMLAFKNITNDDIPTLFFDEVDNGISGITASIVGKKLKEISKKQQIICITHLPQIAAFGSANYRIHKFEKQNNTISTIDKLDYDGKVNEIARLIGGNNITETTLKSARELIDASINN